MTRTKGLAASGHVAKHCDIWVIASELGAVGLQPTGWLGFSHCRLPEEAHSLQRGANRALPNYTQEARTKAGRASAYWSPWKQMQENKNLWVEAGVQV